MPACCPLPPRRPCCADGDKERICKRFWMALILTDIIAEASKGGCLSCAVVSCR